METGKIEKGGLQDAVNGNSCNKAAYIYIWKSRRIRQEEMWHAWERKELHLQFWLGNLKGSNTHLDEY